MSLLSNKTKLGINAISIGKFNEDGEFVRNPNYDPVFRAILFKWHIKTSMSEWVILARFPEVFDIFYAYSEN